MTGHKYSASVSQNHKAQLANAYNELGKELSSSKIKVVGNYTLGRVIGEGTYGTVRLGTHRLTSTRVAIKQIPKHMSAALTREIHHHRRLHHPHVCKLYEVIATESSIWLVTELCSGGELFDYLAEKGRLSEDESRAIFGQLCLAVGYIHEKGVVHRDLKLENVLLDERCRVKLGDFGFTREFERGSLLDTYCGTTGYAAPEMLLAKKYLGPEVDIWSLGIILYCLLTGTLPFDDDDESVMREKIILGEFETPEWLSADARDLVRNILQHDPAKRLTIPQILAHSWFSLPRPPHPPSTSASDQSPAPVPVDTVGQRQHLPSPSPSTSEASFHSAPSAPSPLVASASDPLSLSQQAKASAPGPDESFALIDDVSFDSNASEATVRQKGKGKKHDRDRDVADPSSRRKKSSKGKGSGKRSEQETPVPPKLDTSREPSPSHRPAPSPSAPPTSYPTRTPARTKRRSVSSILSATSQPSSPTSEAHSQGQSNPPPDFLALLRTPAPLLFSTPLERSLLNSLSSLGFDIGQMVHSVLSDACDASGAIWWMLKRKAEKKALEEAFKESTATSKAKTGEKDKIARRETEGETEVETELENGPVPSPIPVSASSSNIPDSASEGQTIKKSLDQSRSAPELTFVPATPTAPETSIPKKSSTTNGHGATSPPQTPPRSKSPRSYLSPTPTSMDSIRSSTHSTPSSSLREKDREKEGKDGSKGRSSGKPRSGSIVQRATMTALEAAGLVRKKSTEAVKDKDKDKEKEKEKDRDSHKEKDKDSHKGKEEDKDKDRDSTESRNGGHGNSNGHTPNRLTKSPPMRPVKDRDTNSIPTQPSTPEHERTVPTALPSSSPWVPVARSSTFTNGAGAPTPANSPGNSGDFTGDVPLAHKLLGGSGPVRNRSSLLTTFRMWFNEDRKGKRKAAVPPPINISSSSGTTGSGAGIGGGVPASPGSRARGGVGGTFRRRGSRGGGGGGWSAAQMKRAKRASMSSRRSSSVNSRRSSVASMQMVLMDPTTPHQHAGGGGGMPDISRQRSDPSRRSFTPSSEMEREVHSSRPSSIRSYSMQNGQRAHRKSPSAGSSGGGYGSPLKQYHRRGGSGSSTRVVRQTRPSSQQGAPSSARPAHVRSNSTASSIHSLPSSRPGSFYDASEGEGGIGQGLRTGSPFRSVDDVGPSSRRTVLLAQKKHSAFGGPSSSYASYASTFLTSTHPHRTSWKKAWGTEPPGWSSRPAHYPSVEVLAISSGPGEPMTIRDVFSGQGKQSISLNNGGIGGDEEEWVDEDDDFPAFAGGLGQIGFGAGGVGVSVGGTNTSANVAPGRQNSSIVDSPVQTHMHIQMQYSPVVSSSSSRSSNRNARKAGRGRSVGGGGTGRTGARAGHSPIAGTMPLPGSDGVFDGGMGGGKGDPSALVNEPRMSRRNLPNGRSAPAFRSAIVEEEEEEEE